MTAVGERIMEGTPTLGDIIRDGFLRTADRHSVVRTGSRREIPWHIRSTVWYRDRGKCQMCGTARPTPWHLDHITPWSAGGPDDTANLRMLCEPCNVARSNHIDGAAVARMPTTWWCHRCYAADHGWQYAEDIASSRRGIATPAGVACFLSHRCRVEAIYALAIRRGSQAPGWHKRPPIEDPTVVAYCAHCDAPGLTDRTL